MNMRSETFGHGLRAAVVIGVGLMGPLSFGAELKTYRVVASESLVYVRLSPNESTLLSGLSHEHVIRAGGLKGRIRWNASARECQVQIDVPVEALVVDEPELRQRLGLKTVLDAGDRETVTEHMQAEDQLFMRRHPRIRFRSKSCTSRPGGVRVKGTLEIRGQKRALTVDLDLETSSGRLRAKGQFTVKHSDFGFKPYSALLGTIKNGEDLRFTLDIIAQTSPGS